MSNKEIQEFNEKLRHGLEIAEKKMLHEKALRGQDVVVSGADHVIKRIPAAQVIAENAIFQD
ncbi:MAG: ribosome recycling factor [Prevotella sp.]|nr:ribosome recycling factor [Prevotella sp.]